MVSSKADYTKLIKRVLTCAHAFSLSHRHAHTRTCTHTHTQPRSPGVCTVLWISSCCFKRRVAEEGEGALAGRRVCKRIQRATFCKKAKTYLKLDHLRDEIFSLLLPLNLLQNSNIQFFQVSLSLPPLRWRMLIFCVNTWPMAERFYSFI